MALLLQRPSFDSDMGAKVFDMPRRCLLVPTPTRRIQIGSKMAPEVMMIFLSELLFVGVYKAIVLVAFVEGKGQSAPKNEKLDKSWKII